MISAACRVRRHQPCVSRAHFSPLLKEDLDCPSKSVEFQQSLPGISSYHLWASSNPASRSHCKLSTSADRDWRRSPPAGRGKRDTVPALAAPQTPACPRAEKPSWWPCWAGAQPASAALARRQVTPSDSPAALPYSSAPQRSRSPQRHWFQTRCAPHRRQSPERHKTTSLKALPDGHLRP